jgi:hypothetical protein
MKKIYKYIFASLVIALSSCSDFLDTYPKDALSPSTTWKTKDDAAKFLTGCYNSWLWGEEFFYLECASDFGFSYHTHEGFRVIGDGTLTAANAGNSFYDFGSIRRCLTFLDNIEQVPFENEADKKDMIAQVKTIRAYEYFKMNWLYGGVPIISSFKNAQEAQVPRNSESEVKDFIYREIDEAIADLRNAPAAAGYIAKGAALALKMRSALFYGDYQRALDAAKAIKALNQYELEADYANIFTLEGRHSKEIILSQQHLKTVAAEWIVTIPNNADGGWSSMVPTQNLINAYEMSNGLTKEEEGSGYEPAHPFNNRDPRMAKTVLYPGQNWASGYNGILNTLDENLPNGTKNPNHPASADNASKTGLTWAKFLCPIEQYNNDFYDTETQYIVYRYAEVLLTLAEASNELNGPSDEAYEALDAVRLRAGMPAVDKVKYSTKDKLRELIRRERSVELAGEGVRRADIIRWKDASGKMLAETLMNGDLLRVKGTVDLSESVPGKRAVISGTEIIETRKFADYNRFLPISQSNMDKNPKLTQTPGY